MINVLKKKYPKNGQFNVSIGQKIKEAAKENDVPNDYGIYLIYEGFDCNEELIYIGRSGTIQSDGTMGSQGIRKRLGMKQDGMYRNDFFKEEMKKRQKGISVAWFVTFNIAGQKTLPALAESEAMQEFYELEGRLPELNKSFLLIYEFPASLSNGATITKGTH